MKRYLPLRIFAAVILAGACTRNEANRSALESMVQAEISFAKTSVAKGIRTAFLAYLADSCIVFRPHPVNGPAAYRERPDSPITLDWRPIYADVSGAGDFGYTTGPWSITDNGPQKGPPRYGNYFSVWQRQAEGNWKVIIDLGISNPEPLDLPASWQAPAAGQDAKVRVHAAGEMAREKSALLHRDQLLSAAALANGIVAAYQSHLAAEARLLRMEQFPITEKEKIYAKLSERQGVCSWRPQHAEMAQSLDLAYTMGAYEFGPVESTAVVERGYYVRMWKRQPNADWQIVLEVESPLPPEASVTDN